MPTKEEKIEVEDEVVEALPSAMRTPSPHDLNRGRITYRHRYPR